MNSTIYLEVSLNQKTLEAEIWKDDSTLSKKEKYEKSLSIQTLENNSCKIAETLNKYNRKNTEHIDVRELINEGKTLCDNLLPNAVKEYLRISTAEYLIVNLDENLVHIPWELLCVEDQFLCQKFSMGRKVEISQEITGSKRNLEKPLKMWILANLCNDLPKATSEGCEIFNNAGKHRKSITPYLDSSLTQDIIKNKLKNYDIVHYASHTDYDRTTGKSIWKLTQGCFGDDNIKEIAGGSAMPSLIFSNSCQSARTETWEEKSFGLVRAFLCAGVKHYIGTFWEIKDESSFASEFYRHLFSGKEIGKAVKESRLALAKDSGALNWASYILYGDPRTIYVNKNDEPVETIVTNKDGITRGKESVISDDFHKNSAPVKKSKNLQIWIIILAVLSVTGFFIFQYFQMGYAKLMLEHIEKKQEQIRYLITKIERKISSEPIGKHPDFLTMSIVYDSVKSIIHNGREDFISSVIENEIKEKCPEIKLLERRQFGIILEELDIASSLVSVENRLKPNLLNAKLILFIETGNSLFESFISMRLIDTETGKSFTFPVQKLKTGRLSSQNLCENLFKTLKERYPSNLK